jgi:conjugative transfer signal peptidase TraF
MFKRGVKGAPCRHFSWRADSGLFARQPIFIGVPMQINPSLHRKTLLVLICLGILQVLNDFYGKRYLLNFTQSEPVGLYRLARVDREVKRGDLVVLNIPSRYREYVYGRNWLPLGFPLLKQVGAVSGDLFCSKNALFTINGHAVGPVYQTDRQGLPLPQLDGCGRVPKGYFIPVAPRIANSFDGRYMGPVSLSEIVAMATPVFVLR